VIIARRPFTILDVDLLGLIALGVLILAGIWVFALPWQRTWDQYWAAAADRVATEQGIRDYAAKLERYRQELDHLQGIVDDQAQTCPDAGRFTDLLEEIAAIAEQSGIQLVSVTPNRACRRAATSPAMSRSAAWGPVTTSCASSIGWPRPTRTRRFTAARFGGRRSPTSRGVR
jgi:hypothetical protein